jgi:hypothetical protein
MDNTFETEKIFTQKEVTELFKLLVVRGCFRGVESSEGRNYKIAIQTLKEQTNIDYEDVVDFCE